MTAERIAALLQRLDAELLACRSATRVLERWCGHAVLALRTGPAEKVLPDEHRRHLALMPHERLAHRHVKLVADGHVLCAADNWYVPDRLTAAMNDALECTDKPFGKVVAALAPSRQVLSARTLWHSAQDPRLAACDGTAQPVLEHQALVVGRDGRIHSLVHEVYMARLLATQRVEIPGAYGPSTVACSGPG